MIDVSLKVMRNETPFKWTQKRKDRINSQSEAWNKSSKDVA